MAKILAPNKDYTGTSASVPFAQGVGHTDNPHLITWFRENGYLVEADDLPELSEMTKEILVALAAENGIETMAEEGKTRKKAALIEDLRAAGLGK